MRRCDDDGVDLPVFELFYAKTGLVDSDRDDRQPRSCRHDPWLGIAGILECDPARAGRHQRTADEAEALQVSRCDDDALRGGDHTSNAAEVFRQRRPEPLDPSHVAVAKIRGRHTRQARSDAT
jgi:hypothetical protein